MTAYSVLASKWAIILCGGRGSRLGAVTHNCPKSLVDVHGKPILWYTLLTLYKHGFRKFILPTGYRARLYNVDGALIADSLVMGRPGGTVQIRNLPPPEDGEPVGVATDEHHGADVRRDGAGDTEGDHPVGVGAVAYGPALDHRAGDPVRLGLIEPTGWGRVPAA